MFKVHQVTTVWLIQVTFWLLIQQLSPLSGIFFVLKKERVVFEFGKTTIFVYIDNKTIEKLQVNYTELF